MGYTMPTIDLLTIDLTDEERVIATQVVKRNGVMYSSKPKKASGDAKYVWRMLAFFVSQNPQHQCIPVTADWDLDIDSYDERRARAKELDTLVEKLENTIPIWERHGVLRWGRALGRF